MMNDEKWANEVKMKGIDLQKKICTANIKKVLRAYQSLNPALLIKIKIEDKRGPAKVEMGEKWAYEGKKQSDRDLRSLIRNYLSWKNQICPGV